MLLVLGAGARSLRVVRGAFCFSTDRQRLFLCLLLFACCFSRLFPPVRPALYAPVRFAVYLLVSLSFFTWCFLLSVCCLHFFCASVLRFAELFFPFRLSLLFLPLLLSVWLGPLSHFPFSFPCPVFLALFPSRVSNVARLADWTFYLFGRLHSPLCLSPLLRSDPSAVG